MMKLRAAIVAGMMLLAGAAPAVAANAKIDEFNDVGSTVGGVKPPIAKMPPAVSQPLVDFTGGHNESSAFGSGTTYIRVNCSARCAIKVGPQGSTIATTADTPLGPDAPEYFGVTKGQVISVVANP